MPHSSKHLATGIAAGIGAGVLWGLVFLAPQILNDFSPYEIAFGRFLFFALISCASVGKITGLIKKFSNRDLWQITLLSAFGFWLYTLLLVWSVQNSGGVITTVVIGILPITIAIAGQGRRVLRGNFLVGLGLLLAGLIVLNVVPVRLAGISLSWTGLFVLLVALGMWTWYAIANTAFQKAHPFVSKRDVISLTGLISFICLLGVSVFVIDFGHLLHHDHLGLYLMCSAVLGVGSTWLAYWLWSVCSTHCPPSISGPLIVAETICGVIFTFIYQIRLPSGYEMLALVLFAIGSVLCIRTEVKNARSA